MNDFTEEEICFIRRALLVHYPEKRMIINKEEAKRFNLDNIDFWYDLTDGGYLDPDTILDSESAERVKEAIDVLREFETELMAALEDMEGEE